MERKEAIRGAYRLTAARLLGRHDHLLYAEREGGVPPGVGDEQDGCDAYLEKTLSGIPEHFSGRLLEVRWERAS